MKQNKKKLMLLGFLITAMMLGVLHHQNETERTLISKLELANAEALANNEYGEHYACFHPGSVYCPSGQYVKYVMTGLSLD